MHNRDSNLLAHGRQINVQNECEAWATDPIWSVLLYCYAPMHSFCNLITANIELNRFFKNWRFLLPTFWPEPDPQVSPPMQINVRNSSIPFTHSRPLFQHAIQQKRTRLPIGVFMSPSQPCVQAPSGYRYLVLNSFSNPLGFYNFVCGQIRGTCLCTCRISNPSELILWFLACDKTCMNAKDACMGSLTSLLGYQVDQASSDWWMMDGGFRWRCSRCSHAKHTKCEHTALPAFAVSETPRVKAMSKNDFLLMSFDSHYHIFSVYSNQSFIRRVFSVRWFPVDLVTSVPSSKRSHTCLASWSAVGSLQSCRPFSLVFGDANRQKHGKTKKEFGVLSFKTKKLHFF